MKIVEDKELIEKNTTYSLPMQTISHMITATEIEVFKVVFKVVKLNSFGTRYFSAVVNNCSYEVEYFTDRFVEAPLGTKLFCFDTLYNAKTFIDTLYNAKTFIDQTPRGAFNIFSAIALQVESCDRGSIASTVSYYYIDNYWNPKGSIIPLHKAPLGTLFAAAIKLVKQL